jgi:hypothetical protein
MNVRIVQAATVVVFAAVLGAVTARLTAAPVDLSGRWKLDTYLSDNPQQVETSIRIDLGLREASLPPVADDRDGRNGRGGRGFGPRGEAGRRDGADRSAQLSSEEQQHLDDVTHQLRYPPTDLTISQTDTSVTFKDELGQSRTFQIGVKHEKQTFGSTTVETTAHWEGPLLVVDFDLTKGRTMTYEYSIVPTTRQLLVRVTFQTGVRDVGPIVIKQVYGREGGS